MSRGPRGRDVSPARRVATEVLLRVARDGAYASPTLDAELARARPDPRDARLAAEIVYGSLRVLPSLDAALLRHLSRGAPEPYTWAALRAAAYQALHLGRVPDFAIAQETVALVRRKRGEGLARLTNAVLRKLLAERPPDPQPALALEVPEWVADALRRGLGPARADRVLAGDVAGVPLGARAVGIAPSVLAERLSAALGDARIEVSPVAAQGVRVWGGGDPRGWPGYAEGDFAVQDEGAQAVGELLGAAPGERIWDACAGRGGKTLQLAAAVGDGGTVVATDLYPEKLERLQDEARRLGVAGRVQCQAVDLRVGTGGVQGPFDRVLVDAPCTGLGTIRRRPEILLRVSREDPARLAALQLQLLERGLSLLRPGGRLVFATCSPTYEEGPGVAAAFEGRQPRLARLVAPRQLASHQPDDDGMVRFGPWNTDGTGSPDVYQTACWTTLDSGNGPV